MSTLKRYTSTDVYSAAKARVAYAFDSFERIYVSFSGGKDSTVMLHMVMAEAKARGRVVGVLIIDLEAQYRKTIEHIESMVEAYKENIDLHWVCLPMLLRNAVTQFEPRWMCWDKDKRDAWVRNPPGREGVITDPAFFDFFQPGMEFEEFMVLFGAWYSRGIDTGGFVGIRCDESLNRFRTIASNKKEMHGSARFTTKVCDGLFNVYPVYDWRTEDIWRFHAANPECKSNPVYDQMHLAGLSIHQMRLCQPYGDDQKRGLWLYHILEPETWSKLIARVNGANSGALYINETGNINGYNKVSRPPGHTWKSFCHMLLATLPAKTRDHFVRRFRTNIAGWKKRGYKEIPDEAPKVLEDKMWAPSWRRMCKCVLRNDHWCKGLGLTQPKSAAYERYMVIAKERKASAKQATNEEP